MRWHRTRPLVGVKIEEEYCPSCGEWGDISEVTGWCLSCTRDTNPDLRYCDDCHTPIPAHHNHKLCSKCKGEKWLATHADRIEAYMMVGWSFGSAKQQVINDIRPICVYCGGQINGGNADAQFCTVNKECRTTQRRFRLYKDKGMDREEALRQAINAGRRKNEHGRFAIGGVRTSTISGY